MPPPAFFDVSPTDHLALQRHSLVRLQKPPTKAKETDGAWDREGSNSDSEHGTKVSVVSEWRVQTHNPPPTVDDKTLKRL